MAAPQGGEQPNPSMGDSADYPIDIDAIESPGSASFPLGTLPFADQDPDAMEDDSDMIFVQDLIMQSPSPSPSPPRPAPPSSPPPIPLPPSPKDDDYVPSSEPDEIPPLIRARRRGKARAVELPNVGSITPSNPLIRGRSPSLDMNRNVCVRLHSPPPQGPSSSVHVGISGGNGIRIDSAEQQTWNRLIEQRNAEEEVEQQALSESRMRHAASQRQAEREDRIRRAREAEERRLATRAREAHERLIASRARDAEERREAARGRRAIRLQAAQPRLDDPPPAYHTLFPDRL